jgi:hypothetical protein
MPIVPAFILRRLYVKNSLHNTTHGWCFTLRNSLGSGYAEGMIPLILDDGTEIPMTHTEFESEGKLISFDQVSKTNTFGLKMNREIEICVTGDPLPTGERKIYFGCIVPGIGKIGFDFTDQVSSQ